MESKDTVRALLWAAMAFFAWQLIAVRIWPPQQPPPSPPASTDGVTDSSSGHTPPGSQPTPDAISQAGQTGEAEAVPADSKELRAVGGPQQSVSLGAPDRNGGEHFQIDADLTTVGAALQRARLTDHTLTPDEQSPLYPMLEEVEAPDGQPVRSFSTEKIAFPQWDEELSLADVSWRVLERDEEHVTFGVEIVRGSTEVLRLRKTFSQPTVTGDSHRHDLSVSMVLQSATDEPLSVILTHQGAVGMRREDRRFDDRLLFVGRRAGQEVSVNSVGKNPDRVTNVYQAAEASEELLWTAVSNKYFVAFESPRPLEGHAQVDWISEIHAARVSTVADDNNIAYTFRTATKPLHLDAGGALTLQRDCYLGPKNRRVFKNNEDYAALGYDQMVLASYSIGPCAFMSFKSLTRLMIWMLNALQAVVINYGIAIIILVLIVRTMLHPITKKGQVNMMRMQQQMGALQPRMEEIRKKYANDRQKQSQETMKLYQEVGVNPMTGMISSCLPMFLQMPIWIALFTSLNYNIDMRHQPFCLWINDLTAPDALIDFGRVVQVPLVSWMTGPIDSFNLLPIFVSLSMFAQQKLMPKPKPMANQSDEQSAQAAQMQKMMPYMTLVFGLFFYNMPSGLNLYIGASSFFGMIEQYRIRKHIEELKKQPPPEPKKKSDPGKKKGSLFERLQKAAEEAEKLRSEKEKKRKRKRA